MQIAYYYLLSCWFLLDAVDGLVENLYCGKLNCYDVLNVSRDATKEEISKNYRQLAKQNHPDRFKTQVDKKAAEIRFRLIATAYETLRDEDQRNDYNFMLDNPELHYQHYWRYYGRRVTPKVDVRIVVAVFITVVSAVQYFVLWTRYNEAIKYLMREPKYRSRALQEATDAGIWSPDKKRGKKSKEEIKEDEDAIVRQILESKMEIRGGYAKPNIRDVLWLKLIFLPLTVYQFIHFQIRWLWRYTIHKMEYTEDDKTYLMRKYLGYSQTQFESVPEKEKEEMYNRELWISQNFKTWKQEKDEKMKTELAQNARYKAYRRWMKKGGGGQITFGPDE
ncbi:dnaJ homolog subfamily C member 25 homolog [Paramacrobiotus metropolitanus]|uniref:dnaJ homolog subfamily C member 25 homolog n=1 Tax=Paramacrobiotus metropolitanus TaxID=2943436 RepID=UPI0024462D3E|nr:dnaJ homolog subfamily C member 25 homolog [Paramacrobiotus metropolitanus]